MGKFLYSPVFFIILLLMLQSEAVNLAWRSKIGRLSKRTTGGPQRKGSLRQSHLNALIEFCRRYGKELGKELDTSKLKADFSSPNFPLSRLPFAHDPKGKKEFCAKYLEQSTDIAADTSPKLSSKILSHRQNGGETANGSPPSKKRAPPTPMPAPELAKAHALQLTPNGKKRAPSVPKQALEKPNLSSVSFSKHGEASPPSVETEGKDVKEEDFRGNEGQDETDHSQLRNFRHKRRGSGDSNSRGKAQESESASEAEVMQGTPYEKARSSLLMKQDNSTLPSAMHKINVISNLKKTTTTSISSEIRRGLKRTFSGRVKSQIKTPISKIDEDVEQSDKDVNSTPTDDPRSVKQQGSSSKYSSLKNKFLWFWSNKPRTGRADQVASG